MTKQSISMCVYDTKSKTKNIAFLTSLFTCKIEQLDLDFLPAKLALVQSVAVLLPYVPQ